MWRKKATELRSSASTHNEAVKDLRAELSNECESMLWNFTYGGCNALVHVRAGAAVGSCKERATTSIEIQTQEMICLYNKHLFAFIVNLTPSFRLLPLSDFHMHDNATTTNYSSKTQKK